MFQRGTHRRSRVAEEVEMPLPDILTTNEGRAEGVSPLDAGMTEFVLLLPDWQVAELEQAAHLRGLTAAQMTRRLIRDFLKQSHHHAD
jgi:hypothetical protein